MKAVRIHEYGPTNVLRYEEVSEPRLTDDTALVRLKAIGVNYTDIYTRIGVYPAKLPVIPGVEGAGVVTAVGSNVNEVKVGETVAYAMAMGSYAEYSAVPAWRLVKIPKVIHEELAAAVLLQGMTAHFLTHDTFPIQRGHRVLIHAGAGGVGLLLIQMAKQLGANVIATTSTDAKANLVREAGADEVIIYTEHDFEEQVKKLTNGVGVNAVYDSVGKTTFEKSLRCLSRRGYLVSFGQSSGVVQPIPPLILRNGSLFLTRPVLDDYIASREELQRRANDLFGLIMSQKLRVRISKIFPLSQAAEAQQLLENRGSTGKLLLVP